MRKARLTQLLRPACAQRAGKQIKRNFTPAPSAQQDRGYRTYSDLSMQRRLLWPSATTFFFPAADFFLRHRLHVPLAFTRCFECSSSDERAERRVFIGELRLVDARVLPGLSRGFDYALAPLPCCGVLLGSAFPNSALGFDDPVHFAVYGLLDDHPVRIIEADRPIRLQIVDTEFRPGVPLFRRAECREAGDISDTVPGTLQSYAQSRCR